MTAYIYDAVRSPRGKARPDGGLASLSPDMVVRQLVDALDARNNASARRADALLLGCVGQVGSQGANIALVSKLRAGLPDAASATSLNNYCVSGISAIGQAAARVTTGQDDLVLAGGVEMMSQVGFMADKAAYYTDPTFPSRERYIPVALAADRLAAHYGLDRAALDAVALASQARAAAAQNDPGLNASRVAIKGADGRVLLDRDECVRPTTAEQLAGLQPAFGELITAYSAALDGETITPLHTVGHAPPMCDGAGLALIGGKPPQGVKPRARIVAVAEAGADPHASLTAGYAAMERALKRAKLALDDIDQIQFMEAFAVTIARFLRDYPVDRDRVNVGGGHIARGHPLGASGAILVSTLLDTLDASDGRYGLAVASGASGVGAAIIVERLS